MVSKQISPLYSSIYEQVRKVPSGHVTTYGQIARLVGCTARTVGFAMAALPAGSDVPWQRVINRLGRVSQRTAGDGNILQCDLLRAEGLQFDRKGQINLDKHGWDFKDYTQDLENKRDKHF